jgi:hypothetical protein
MSLSGRLSTLACRPHPPDRASMSGPIRSTSICARPGSVHSSMSRRHCRARATTKPRFCRCRYGCGAPGGRSRCGSIDGTDPFATTKLDARLIKLLIRARRLNAALVGSDGVPFAALAKQEGVSPSYFTRLVRLSYLAPDITQAILDGRQSRDLTGISRSRAASSGPQGLDRPGRLAPLTLV